MPEQGSTNFPQGQNLGGQDYQQFPPSPAPTGSDSEQVRNNEIDDMESSDTEMVEADRSDITGDQKTKAGVSRRIDIDINEPTSSNQASQNNGVYAPGPVVAKIRVKKPTAKDTSLQNNGVVGFEDFWSRNLKEADS